MDGVLVIDKPPGPTSHDVVAMARRALRETRVGHTGTLDPFASGVLPLVVGRATRLAQFLTHTPKAYHATVRLGTATTTYDRMGTPLARERWVMSPAIERPGRFGRSSDVSDSDIVAALSQLAGTLLQRPPAFSAKKIAGQKAYDLARADTLVALEPVPVTLLACRVLARQGDAITLDIECSAGFYVRSLAHDLGVALGCGAHVAELRRTKSGPFGLDAAIGVEGWADAPRSLIGLDGLLPWMPGARLSPEGLGRARQGQPLGSDHVLEALAGTGTFEPGAGGQQPEPMAVRMISPDGHLVGLARKDETRGLLHPFLNLV